MSARNDWIWNNGGTYDTNSHSSNNPFNFLDTGLLGGVDNFLGWALFGDEKSSSQLFGELTGYNSQQREFQQQEYLQDKQNLYNLPANQMQRMKDAGINPNTAAAGISQGGNESAQAPQVSTNTQGAAQGLNAAAGAVSSLGQLSSINELNQSQADLNNAQANESRSLLGIKRGLYLAQTQEALEAAGLSHHQGIAFAIENVFRGESLLLDIAAKRFQLPILRQTFRNLQKDYDIKVQQIKNMEQDIIESGHRINLMDAQALRERKTAMKIEAETWYQNAINQTMTDFHFDPRWASNSVMFGIATDTSITDEEAEQRFDAIMDNIYGVYSAQEVARNQAEYDKGVGLIQAQENATKRINKEQRKGEFWNNTTDKWIRVPSSATVGPFSMSTQ